MTDHKQQHPSEEIRVSIDHGSVVIEHSEAYLAQRERYFAGEQFSRQERAANQRLIEAEEAQMEAARRDPEAFLKAQQARLGGSRPPQAATEPAPANDFAGHGKPVQPPRGRDSDDAERLARAERAFAEAGPEDRAVAEKNLARIRETLTERMAALQNTPGVSPDMLVAFQSQALTKAYLDEADKLQERTLAAANEKDNALTWEVANFAQGAGKTLVNADVGLSVATGATSYGASASRGVNAAPVGLTLAEVNAGVTTDNQGAVGAHAGVRGVKEVYGNGDHHVFVAGAADMTVSGVTAAEPSLGGSATGLVVNTHTLAGRPTSEIGGAVVDLQTGGTTLVGSVSQTFNADTRHATTARAVGTYGIESGAGGFSLEVYQRTGIDQLTARLSAGVNNVGETNDVSVGAGLSLGF